MEFLSLLFALVSGLLGGWFLGHKQLSRTREELAALKAKAQERASVATREKEFFDQSLKEMKSKFVDLAQTALQTNNQQFLQNTEVKLKPLSDALKTLHERTGEMEKKREQAYGQLSQQIRDMAEAASGMLKSSERMQTLLKGSSQVRGNWGEYLLRNVVEFAGMQEHVHFEEQPTLADGSRPDMIIRLPGGTGIPVDSKCPFEAFQEAKEETDPLRIGQRMEDHARAVGKHVDGLGRKDYSAAVGGDIDFTVMFIPGDHLLEAALTVNPQLQDEALKKRILIVNPVSLVALLRTVRIYWRQEETDRNSRQIAEAARDLYDRTTVWMKHVGKLGKGLSSAISAYNDSVGSYQRRIVPAGEKLKAFDVPGPESTALDDEKTAPALVEEGLRELPGIGDQAP
ncbi:MAG: DNA recombination protein RmuC [Acidobacteria bacterium]|nr:DNA recombination protein RmuC [Acidobacteriota bacterium]|tara:strand:- start:1264 stop:2463 length:1200 start_codon:yes stop_codon:yes gene_type:complete